MNLWLPFALAAVLIWSIQRVVTKAALVRWSTARFYRLNAILSLAVYVPFALFRPPDPSGLAGALALSLLMAATFWVTTEATRRGPVGIVAPLTALSPAITVMLAVGFLREPISPRLASAIVLALIAATLLAYRPVTVRSISGWLALALASLGMQGVGAFIAKVVVTGPGPTDLLLTSSMVQVAVGAVLARGEPFDVRGTFRGSGIITVATLVAASLATIGYLTALSLGPASVIVPLVATSPSLGGLLGILVLREQADRRQFIGIAFGLVAAVLLATS